MLAKLGMIVGRVLKQCGFDGGLDLEVSTTLKTEIHVPPLLLFRGPLGQLQDLQEHLQDIATILGHILAPLWVHLGVV